MHRVIRFKIQISHSFEHLAEMGLNPPDFFGLREDLKEVIIGQEVEAAEVGTFLLQVVLQAFLNQLKIFIAISKSVSAALNRALHENFWLCDDCVHDGSPLDIDSFEALALLLELLLDIRRIEYRLEVHPVSLSGDPLVKSVGD